MPKLGFSDGLTGGDARKACREQGRLINRLLMEPDFATTEKRAGRLYQFYELPLCRF